ncbi:hypothetical protein MRBLWO14_002820 [Microbacterium sp. LWO14-1.2]|uniref:hypothetical protein n=1 Tax=Microbacterium sp. LWO14-1.2 TaxID=3135263 RepID=UPI0031388A2F
MKQAKEPENWLTFADAAARIGVTVDSIRRYVRRDGLIVLAGRVRESELLEVERDARHRNGGRGNATPPVTQLAARRYCTERAISDHDREIIMAFAKHVDQRNL